MRAKRIQKERELELTGKKFTRLTAIRYSHHENNMYNKKVSRHFWVCVCDCSPRIERIIQETYLLSGKVKSCGCFMRESVSRRRYKHGHAINPSKMTPEYKIWAGMKKRINNKKNQSYSKYGGRGIKYDPRWEFFENFLEDMGTRPSENLSIERIDNDGDYCKLNCKWATDLEQASNTSRNKYIIYKEEKLTYSQLERKLGFNPGVITQRIARGLSIEDAINRSVRKTKFKNIQRKISIEDKRMIKKLALEGIPRKEIACLFNINKSYVSIIKHNQNI